MKRFFVGRTQSSSNASFMTHMFIRDLGERRDGIASVPESGIINSIEFVEVGTYFLSSRWSQNNC